MPNKNLQKLKIIFWLAILFCGVAAGIFFINIYSKKKAAQQTKYKAFGIYIPSGYSIHGIDVSKYQEYIDWPSVAKMKVKNIQLQFAIIKATEGLTLKDEQFERNWRKTSEIAFTKGAYHFFIPTKSGKAQAGFFIRNVKLKSGDLAPVIDIEQLYGVSPANMRKELKACLDAVEEHYGVSPIIYTYATFYSNYLGKDFDAYPLWIAHYFEPQGPRINREWQLWQHSERGKVNGIRANVDFNVFNGDADDFEDLLLP